MKIFEPTQAKGVWRIRYNKKLDKLYDAELSTFLRLKRLQWVGHIARMDDYSIPKTVSEGFYIFGKPYFNV